MAHRKGGMIWQHIIENMDALNAVLEGEGRVLYLTRMAKRVQSGDVSLMLHTTNPSRLAGFIIERIAQIDGVTGVKHIGLHRPHFFPVHRDTSLYERFAVRIDTQPAACEEVYTTLTQVDCPDCLHKSYICYNFGDFDSTVQFSLLTEDEQCLREFLGQSVAVPPGVRGYEVMPVEATHPLINYDEWKTYATRHGLTTSWDDTTMIKGFSR